MIDVSNIDSYPIELEAFIMEAILSLSDSIITKIKETEIKYDIDVRCAIEDYLSPSRAEPFYTNLINHMDSYDLVVYHGTKILNKSLVLDNGLKVNDWDRYSALLYDSYKAFGINSEDIQETLSLIECEYNRKYTDSDRYAQLCFFSALDLIGDENAAGYEQFCENIGGEVARWALEENYPDKYKLLKENGEAFFVKFKIQFADIALFQKEKIAYQFVSYYFAKNILDFSYKVEFDSMTTQDILPNNILKMIPYNMEIES